MGAHTAEAIKAECDNCGCDQFIVYVRESDGRRTVYIECDACGASVLTVTENE